MNPFGRRSHRDADAPDSVVEAWFERCAQLPGGDDQAIERGRRLVASKLAAPLPATGGASLRRRLALAGAGGGGLWASMLGAAAAHPLVSAAAALAIVAGGATAAEVTGVGPAVREVVGVRARTIDEDASSPIIATTDVEGAGATSPTPTASSGTGDPDGPSEAAIIEPAPEGLPGNLVTQLHNGRFTLRARLDAADGQTITLLAAGGALTLSLGGDADIQLPGKPDAASDLASMLGRIVIVIGSCDAESETVGEDCTVERVEVLGGPARNEPPVNHPQIPGSPGQTGTPGAAPAGTPGASGGGNESSNGNANRNPGRGASSSAPPPASDETTD